jgi:hypothetical protein
MELVCLSTRSLSLIWILSPVLCLRHYLIISAVTNLLVNLLGVWFFRSYARVHFGMFWTISSLSVLFHFVSFLVSLTCFAWVSFCQSLPVTKAFWGFHSIQEITRHESSCYLSSCSIRFHSQCRGCLGILVVDIWVSFLLLNTLLML